MDTFIAKKKIGTSLGAFASLLGALSTGWGQQTADRRSEDVVRLSPFEVLSSAPARYQAAESAAGGRITTSILDSPTSVTVLTSDFLNDIGGTRVLEAAKYVAGVSEATLPHGLDRIMIRGFQTDGRRVDGFNMGGQANYDHGAIERVEVIKGPDSVLHPSGTPGGTINLVTKKPQWARSGSLKLQLGQYEANRFESDVTGPVNDNFAYRFVAAIQDNEGYIDNLFRESTLLTPSLAWRVSPRAQIVFRYEYYDFRSNNLTGVPTDPSVSTSDRIKYLQIVPRNFNPSSGRDYEFRRAISHSGTWLFTSTITDRLSVRLAGRVAEQSTPDSDLRLRVDPWGSRNPFTGEWEAGLGWQNISTDPANPDFVATVLPPWSPIIGLTGTKQDQMERYRDVQNDWSYIAEGRSVNSTTLVGFAYAYYHNNLQNYRRTAPSIDVSKGEYNPSSPAVVGPMVRDNITSNSRYQVYVTEQLELFDKRLVISAGVAHLSFNGMGGDRLEAAQPSPNETVDGQIFSGAGSRSTYNYGLVVKMVPSVSLYYGHTENAVPSGDYKQMTFGTAPVFAEGTQDEFGVKGSFFEGRIITSVAYYEIEQTGYSIFNPGNFATPQPPVILPPIITTRNGRGWEFQVAGALTPSLSMILSYSDTTNRNPDGVMFSNAAEDLGSAYLRYEVGKGALRGLAFALGVNYTSKRAGGNTSGYTEASTPDSLIPNQPLVYAPAQTLADLTLSYARSSWSYGLTVSNLLDKDYFAAVGDRNQISVGNPRHVSGSITWKF